MIVDQLGPPLLVASDRPLSCLDKYGRTGFQQVVVPTEIRTRIATLRLFYSKIEADLRRMDDSHKSGSSQKLITIEEKNASTDEAELKENRKTKKNPMMLECDTSNVEMMTNQLTVLSERAAMWKLHHATPA